MTGRLTSLCIVEAYSAPPSVQSSQPARGPDCSALPAAQSRADWADRICAAWRRGVEAIIETGRVIAEAKAALPHGAFLDMIDADLPFSASTAQRLMKVGSDARLSNAARVQHLPPSWGTLYELTKLDDESFDSLFEAGLVRPDMERRDVVQARNKERRADKEAALAENILALPDRRYGVIYADPEWRFEPWSRETGLDRAADNHYPTSPIEAIKARPVGDIAAKDCVLFLWATAPMLPHALEVMAAWGFAYKSHVVWVKMQENRHIGPDEWQVADMALGTGYWFRNTHELLLVGTRGNIPAPAPGEQLPSVIYAPVGRHSEKPARFAELIESYYPTVPRIELNARGTARAGWDAWGNEVEQEAREGGAPTGTQKEGWRE